jgi:hypothetical protein
MIGKRGYDSSREKVNFTETDVKLCGGRRTLYFEVAALQENRVFTV